mgnify:FL=1|tara:strand:+ start:1533 stop:2120 length:588 start_codon:yes stop_codon:yes gene_type:complete
MAQVESMKAKWSVCITVVVASAIAVVVWKRERYWVPQGKFPPMTRMMLAAWEGDRDKVMKYIEIGKNVNDKTDLGTTAFSYAVRREHYDIAKLLISSGANPSTGNHQETQMFLQLARNGEIEFLTYLFDYIDTNSDEYWYALIILLSTCDVQALETVLQSIGEQSSWELGYIRDNSHLGNDCVSEMQSLADRFEK